jgi:hypothetical protein
MTVFDIRQKYSQAAHIMSVADITTAPVSSEILNKKSWKIKIATPAKPNPFHRRQKTRNRPELHRTYLATRNITGTSMHVCFMAPTLDGRVRRY